MVSVSPTYTDRPKRPGEIELEHKFVSSEEFEELNRQGAFLETVQLFGLPFRYGLPPIDEKMGKIPLVMLRAPLIKNMRAVYPDIAVYQIEAPAEVVKGRLKDRQESNIGSRLSDYEKEVTLGRKISDRVYINDGSISKLVDNIATTCTKIYISIQNDRCKELKS